MKRVKSPVFLLLCAVLLLVLGGASAGFKSYYSGDTDTNQIAITVDDCYGLDHLESILDLCQTYEIHVTFFPIGAVIKPEDAALWQRIVDEGHEIGNHTFGHPNILNLDKYQLSRQLTRMQNALNAVLAEPYTLHLFRPPYGKYEHTAYGNMEALDELEYPYVILWNVDGTEANKVFKATEGGSILLFHTNKADVTCLETLIPMLLDAGFAPVTVSELLDLPPAGSGTDDGN